jgi:hypothetical protein
MGQISIGTDIGESPGDILASVFLNRKRVEKGLS